MNPVTNASMIPAQLSSQLLWHGTKRAEAICSNGFAFFGKHALFENPAAAGPNVDIGFFGSGIYFTNSAQYAAMYSANKVGGTLLLAWVSMREPYPVVSDTPVPKEGTDMTRLRGKGAYKNYNAHYIPVTSTDPADPENMIFHPCHRFEKPAWDEYVVFHTAQTLACFQVELGVDFPAAISPVGGVSPGAGPGAPANSVENLLDKLLELLDCSEVQADKELASLLSSKSDAIASLNLKSALSTQDQEFYNWTLKLLDPAGKPRNLVKQKLMQKPTASPPKLEGKGAGSVSALTEETIEALYKQASAGDVEALQKLRQQAEAGVAFAQCILGFMHANGRGIAKDEREAVRLYQLAAAQGNAFAQCNLGNMHRDGRGVAKDEREAVRLYQLAAAQGNAFAQCNLGYMYEEGQGVAKDEREAVRWYQLAAAQGNALAQNNLGLMYANGRGVAKDEREAVRWFQLSAAQGHAQAQCNLGSMYGEGQGVAKDVSEEIKWYQRAAAQGHAAAQYNLGTMYLNGQGVAKDELEAVRLYKLAVAQGHAAAQCNLGVMLGNMYRDGRGVAKDEREAVRLYQLAAAQGDAYAQQALKRLG